MKPSINAKKNEITIQRNHLHTSESVTETAEVISALELLKNFLTRT